MRLFIESYNIGQGYVLSKCYSDCEISLYIEEQLAKGRSLKDAVHTLDVLSKPIKSVQCPERAIALIHRYNRRYATH